MVLRSLHDIVNPNCFRVQFISASQLNEGKWRASAAAIVFPGGADRLYFEELESKGGNHHISEFVHHDGGCYVGFCAGAYYGCQRVLFDINGPLEVNENRTLKFYQGAGVGPVFDGFDYNSEKGSRAASIVRTDTGKSVDVYYNGGCFFQDEARRNQDDQENAASAAAGTGGATTRVTSTRVTSTNATTNATTRVTSYYATADASSDAVSNALSYRSDALDSSEKRLAASVEISMPNGGTAILCGVHPEYQPHQMLSPSKGVRIGKETSFVSNIILKNDEERCEYLRYLLSPLLLKGREIL